MIEVENDLKLINERVSDLFQGASLIKFSYSGLYTLEFDLPREVCGFNFFFVDIGTQLSIFDTNKQQSFIIDFSIESFLLIWSKNVRNVIIDNELALSIFFDNNYCCKIESKLFDPERLIDMRWSIYQQKNISSFYLSVSDEENIYLQTP